MPLHRFQRAVFPIQRLAGRALSLVVVIVLHDNVGTAEILAEDGMPQRRARTAMARGQFDQIQMRGPRRIVFKHGAQCAHARVMIRLAHAASANRGLNQQRGVVQVGRALGKPHVGAMHEMTRLITHHALRALPTQQITHGGGCLAQ
jgi:hypothetical protein